MEGFLLVFARSAALVALHPVFGGRTLPRPIAVGIAAAIAFGVANLRDVEATAEPRAPLPLRLLAEAVTGAMLGVLGQLAFGAIEAAGRLADDARGAGTAQVYAPQTESFPSPLGALDVHLATALYWSAGLHTPLVAVLASSYDVLPTHAIDLHASTAFTLDEWLAAAGGMAKLAVAIAAPAVAACAVADALFGLINRAASQANVFFLSLSAKLGVALMLTALTLPGRIDAWAGIWSMERAARELVGARVLER
jgi:flagellar biosynthetic protein FliR